MCSFKLQNAIHFKVISGSLLHHCCVVGSYQCSISPELKNVHPPWRTLCFLNKEVVLYLYGVCSSLTVRNLRSHEKFSFWKCFWTKKKSNVIVEALGRAGIFHSWRNLLLSLSTASHLYVCFEKKSVNMDRWWIIASFVKVGYCSYVKSNNSELHFCMIP